ncbi:MAG: hypothetical protein JG777_1914 [Clostridia bacterium]|nr:hypothetical protein [Clostridia bacterium]
MKYFIDLHIHSALSPCADDDMTPNNIVNMAILKNLDFIAITDHNATGNVQAAIECARGKDIIVIPGMEVQSSEEVHMVCLFPTVQAANQMEQLVQQHLPKLDNRPDIFGYQILYDTNDEFVGYNNKLLVTATSLSINVIKNEVEKLGGVTIPSHIDRKSFSIIANLGFIPEELEFSTVEISKCTDRDKFLRENPDIGRYTIISNSDAHHLYDISEADESIEMADKTIDCLLNFLRNKKSIF